MRTFIAWLASAALAAVILYLAANPDTGLVHRSPGIALSIALIGIGLCKHAKERAA